MFVCPRRFLSAGVISLKMTTFKKRVKLRYEKFEKSKWEMLHQ